MILRAEEPPRWRVGERLEHLFEQRCDELPDAAVAVDGPDGAVTYRELDARANRLARALRHQARIEPGERLALLFDRPLDGYVAMLAALKLHCPFVPLDLAFPPDRIAYIAEDAGVRAVLCPSRLKDRTGGIDAIPVDELEVEVSGASHRLTTEDTAAEDLSAEDLCYVIYTSGTTGRPKGVAISHASICNFVRVAAGAYGVRADDRMYQGLTLAFDFSVEEIWVAWMAGATLVPKPAGGALLGEDLHDFLTENRVTALCAVPTLLATIEQDVPGLRFLLVSGEACPPDLVARWHRPGRRFLNVYGPTEATVSATWTELHPARPVTIGTPLPTYSALVLDPDTDRTLPPGELGELGLAGIGLADGYLNRPELTAQKFVPDFAGLPHNPSRRIYRTGDLVRINDVGEIEHHGRIDTQVKIRGYRIELAEIESVLRALPGVAHAVVTTYQPTPAAAPELAAYYVPRPHGAPPAETAETILAHLREQLPPYMVPAYLEPISAVPLMPSGKADHRALPAPSARRQAAATNTPPGSELEALLAQELATVLGLEQVSVESHFFDGLGANSLLMARFAARARRRGTSVSMRDVYLHPTVRALANAIDLAATTATADAATADAATADAATAETPQALEVPDPEGTPRPILCGALQLLSFLLLAGGCGAVVDAVTGWLFAAQGAGELALRSLGAGAGTLLGLALLPIAAKWLLIGRFRPRSIRVWSLAYLRFWVVKSLAAANPLPHLLVGTPLYPLYLRAMGARVAPDALILSQHVPICADLIEIGAGAVVNRDVRLAGYRARAGVIEIGPVTVGPGAHVGAGAVLDIHTSLGARARLAHASSLQAGQSVPSKQSWHGSPALPAPHQTDPPASVPPMQVGRARAVRCAAARLAALLVIAGPLEALLGGLLIAHPRWEDGLGPITLLAIPAAVVLGLIAFSLAIATATPRLLARALKPDRAYPLYGWRYSVQRLIDRASNNPLLTGLFGDSAAIVHYLRLIGYRFGQIEQTGSNFGLQVRHDVPQLSHIGTGTMVSDGLSIVSAEFSSTSFRVRHARIGAHNYIGNAITFPAGARTGENVLFATKALVPLDGPVREDVGLLGSPAFEIPRSVRRDRQFDALWQEPERSRRLAAKARHNLVTAGLHLLVDYLLVLGCLAVASAPLGGAGDGIVGWASSVASTVLEIAYALGLFVIAERAATRFRRLEPHTCSILDRAFWRHERYWKVAPTGYGRLLDGTPFKPLLWRALGVRVGRGVFDDGLGITERTLVAIGDGCTFNAGATLQGHTLEDGTFKSGRIELGARCTVGAAALVNYDVVLEDGACVDTDAFVMKGSRVAAGSRWGGNPATEIAKPRTLDLPLEPELAVA